jgi:hypothetical protein
MSTRRRQPPRRECTASGQQRTWPDAAWINGRGPCPDCGRDVALFVGANLSPHARASRHVAPMGVTLAPYAAATQQVQP